jgi:hypothetical protein
MAAAYARRSPEVARAHAPRCDPVTRGTWDYAPLVPRWSLPTRRPPLAVGVVATLTLVAVETAILYPLAEVAEPDSLGVVFLLGVLLISIV